MIFYWFLRFFIIFLRFLTNFSIFLPIFTIFYWLLQFFTDFCVFYQFLQFFTNFCNFEKTRYLKKHENNFRYTIPIFHKIAVNIGDLRILKIFQTWQNLIIQIAVETEWCIAITLSSSKSSSNTSSSSHCFP